MTLWSVRGITAFFFILLNVWHFGDSGATMYWPVTQLELTVGPVGPQIGAEVATMNIPYYGPTGIQHMHACMRHATHLHGPCASPVCCMHAWGYGQRYYRGTPSEYRVHTYPSEYRVHNTPSPHGMRLPVGEWPIHMANSSEPHARAEEQTADALNSCYSRFDA